MTRYARYAAAALFTWLAVGFVALWARSYWRLEILEQRTDLQAFQISSVNGRIAIGGLDPRVTIGKFYLNVVSADSADWRKGGVLGFAYYDDGLVTAFSAPHWFLAASSLGLAALFTFKRTWRYSLRTILIATTLLAAILGLAVYAIQ
jgi:hypothetical protein